MRTLPLSIVHPYALLLSAARRLNLAALGLGAAALVVVVAMLAAIAAPAPAPYLSCHEDEVWTYVGDFPARADQFECVPFDNLIGA